MSAELAIVPQQAQADLTAIERVVVAGDLSKLTPDERWNYYRGVCQSVGLNPFTQPFLYITLSGKLVLYATKGAADQLRDNHHISISQPKIDLSDGLCIVTVTATDKSGRTDSDLGIVPCENLRGDAKANAILKAVTKAKRRVTLSMCGLGMLDETEVDAIPSARPANVETIPQHALMKGDAADPETPPQPANDDGPPPQTGAWGAMLRQKWENAEVIAKEVGAIIPDKPDGEASRDAIVKALREASEAVQSRQKLNETFKAKKRQADILGAKTADIDPAGLDDRELHEMLATLDEIIAGDDSAPF